MLSRLKTISTLGKTEEVANLLIDAEKAGKTIVQDGEKLVVKDGDEVLTTIEKNGEQVVISSANNILKLKQGEALSVFTNSNGEKFNCIVEHVRNGNNSKYVIMGRSMAPIRKVAEDLEKLVGKGNVRILDDAYLNGKTFSLGEYEFTLLMVKK